MGNRASIEAKKKAGVMLAGEEGFEPFLPGPATTKKCSRCGETKPLDDFYRVSKSSDQRGAWCKVCSNESRHRLYITHLDREKQRAHERYIRLGNEIRRYNNNKNQELKALLVAHYSNNTNRCACCGETEVRFLTIDHINGDGSEHRKTSKCGTGSVFYRWLKREGMPEGYQVLCYNCNNARAWHGKCPHQVGVTNG